MMPLSKLLALLASALLTISAGAAIAQTSTPVPDQVEEDWQLVIANPDLSGNGPQITSCMSPVGDGSTPFVAFDMNYREFPVYQPGGMQLQAWSGKKVLATSSFIGPLFNTAGETLTWTQRMGVANGTVSYQIANGQSVTWGNFGQGDSQLSVSYNTTATSMAGYNPSLSVANSGVTWESNLVTSMTLLRVRYYANGQLIATDTTARQVSLGN
jgi:hypothetical protein